MLAGGDKRCDVQVTLLQKAHAPAHEGGQTLESQGSTAALLAVTREVVQERALRLVHLRSCCLRHLDVVLILNYEKNSLVLGGFRRGVGLRLCADVAVNFIAVRDRDKFGLAGRRFPSQHRPHLVRRPMGVPWLLEALQCVSGEAALVDNDVVELAFLLLPLPNILLHRVPGDESVDVDIARLPYTVCPVGSLPVHGGVPVGVVEYHNVSAREIYANATSACGCQEKEYALVEVETVNKPLSLVGFH
eukprot:CAMPEP_0117468178 /NCGR_PEP_ID=MMETSP0784-20121206/6040_1 /TAXON_ID=39447 /ORGANISM="" /LENGTH=246 /DNA_ID=CAMNT_0005262175 /DNA_START=137 /DNA_END=878 /DNA_ORIENTATION=-